MNIKGKYNSSRRQSFNHAFHGIYLVFSSQVNFRIQLSMAIAIIILGAIFSLNPIEWTILFLSIGMVLSLEAINTALEVLCDKVDNHYSKSIKKVKDIAAGAVLLTSITATIIGVIIFIPKFFRYFT